MLGVWEEAHRAGLGALQDTDFPFSKECEAPSSGQASPRPSRRKLRHKARKRLPAATQCARGQHRPQVSRFCSHGERGPPGTKQAPALASHPGVGTGGPGL